MRSVLRAAAPIFVFWTALCASERQFSEATFSLPASIKGQESGTTPLAVTSDEFSLLLAVVSGQEVKISDLDENGDFLNAVFSRDIFRLFSGYGPKTVVITMVNELDHPILDAARGESGSPIAGEQFHVIGSGGIEIIERSLHRMGTDITPRIVDNKLVHEAIKAVEAQAAVDAATMNMQSGGSIPAAGPNAETSVSFTNRPTALSDKCDLLFQEEKYAIARIAEELEKWLATQSGPVVISLNPSQVTDCLRHEGRPQSDVDAAGKQLLTLTDTLAEAAREATGGDAFMSMIFYSYPSNGFKHDEQVGVSRAGKQPQPELALGQPPHGNVVISSSPQLRAIFMRRRLQQTGELPPIPYSIGLWLCVVLVAFLIGGVLPLWWLSDLNDPAIDTKLFAGANH